MRHTIVSLAELPLGKFGRVKELQATDRARRRMLDLGLVVNTEVEALRKSPSGDPTAYQIRGAVIALRREEAKRVLVEVTDANEGGFQQDGLDQSIHRARRSARDVSGTGRFSG